MSDTARKPKGSDSAKKVLEHAHRGLELMAEYQPATMGATQAFMREVMKPGKLSRKEKELMSLGMAIVLRCHYCIIMHVRACKAVGVTLDEIMETCAVAIMMGGGPALTYTAEVERAANLVYLDEEGEPVD